MRDPRQGSKLALAAALFAAAACAASSPAVGTSPAAVETSSADGPELELKAPRAVFLRPTMPNQRRRTTVTVRVTGQLQKLDEAEDLEEYYCLEEIWDWDDDTDSEYEPDCDPYEPGMEIKRHFSASHQYRQPGTYNVWLRLQRNGKTIIADSVNVQIRN